MYSAINSVFYYSVLNKSKKVRLILGHNPKMHTSVLNHVVQNSAKFVTPTKKWDETDVEKRFFPL